MKPLAPKTLLQNRYQIVEIIGKGGMGEVYLATDTRLGNEVALKRTTVGDDQHLAAAFEREARTLAGLRHPVLPKVTDHFLENDEQFLVMDFIDGEDLSERLKRSPKPFPLNWVLFWADQLLEALSYLHTNVPPIIHRDIKPQNLKLTAENQIVLLDFGLSKNALGNTRVTTSGSVVGYTPHYAPMEQIRGTGTNAKSDLYALSATLYQLLTNTVPPDALTRADSMLGNLPDPLRPLTELNGEISETLAGAISKGMEISQDKRFADARQMQKALRRAYTTMQESMAAETVAFSVDKPHDPDAGMTDSDAKTEVGIELPIPTSPGQPGAIPTEAPGSVGAVPPEVPSVEKTEMVSTPEMGAEPAEMDVTRQVAEGQGGFDDIEPDGAKTDVLLGSEFADEDDSLPAEAPTGFDTKEDVPVGDDTGLDFGDADEAVPSTPGAETPTAAGFTPVEFETSDEIQDSDEGPPEMTATPAAAVPPPGKKTGKSSAGKYIAILLGLGAFLVLLLGATAGGLWYYTRGVADTGNDNSADSSPTVESTVEDTLTTETTPDDVNVNAENGTVTDENANTGVDEPTATPSTVSTPQATPNVRRTPATRPTAVKTPLRPPPTVKPKPTPTKKKDPGVI